MNIRVDLNTPINDGTEVVFRSPVDCSQITGLIVYYNGESKEFAFADAHGNNVGDIDHLFAENVVVKVILDVTSSMAFVQNADTNAYLEGRFGKLEEQIGKIAEGNTPDIDYSVYFNIEYDGVVSLKPEYRGKPEKNNYPDSVSDNGVGVDGSKINELPEVLVIPDVINNIAASALCEGMFRNNLRVKSIAIPAGVTTIPKGFADLAANLAEIKGTENIEVINQAAFQRCGIKKAIFPNLKAFEGPGHFNGAANLAIVDIGNTIKALPTGCFNYCDMLSLVRGGASVTQIGQKAFFGTRSLKNLPFVSNATSIQNDAFVLSRVTNIGTKYSDWWDFFAKLQSAFNTNSAASVFNKDKWWEGCTYEDCANTLGSTFNQSNPEWAELMLLTDTGECADKWGDACMELSAIHICSALKNIKLNTPMEFMELLRGKTDEKGSLLTPTAVKDGLPNYGIEDMPRWFKAMGLDCEYLVYNKDTMQKVYTALAEGALCLSYVYTGSTGGHANTIYGVAENGELLVLEPQSNNYHLKEYSARTFQQPVWSLATDKNWVMIVSKPKEE